VRPWCLLTQDIATTSKECSHGGQRTAPTDAPRLFRDPTRGQDDYWLNIGLAFPPDHGIGAVRRLARFFIRHENTPSSGCNVLRGQAPATRPGACQRGSRLEGMAGTACRVLVGGDSSRKEGGDNPCPVLGHVLTFRRCAATVAIDPQETSAGGLVAHPGRIRAESRPSGRLPKPYMVHAQNKSLPIGWSTRVNFFARHVCTPISVNE
jgi:hypothetical protein